MTAGRPTQFSYFVNRWQNNAPEGAIFSFVPAPLAFDVPRGRTTRVLFVRLASVSAGAPPLVLAADGRAPRAATLVPLEHPVREQFTWYAVRVPPAASHLVLRFGVDPNGLAISQIRTGQNTSSFRAIPLPASVPDVHARVRVISASPTRIAADVTTTGTGTCSATLLTGFDPRWTARTATDVPLTHFVADGWANGYALPCGSAQSVTFRYDGVLFDWTAMLGRLLLLVLAGAVAWYESTPLRMRLRSFRAAR